jgi:hypothetical protein
MFHKILFGSPRKNHEVSMIHGIHWRSKKCLQVFHTDTQVIHSFENLGVDERKN